MWKKLLYFHLSLAEACLVNNVVYKTIDTQRNFEGNVWIIVISIAAYSLYIFYGIILVHSEMMKSILCKK